MSSADSRGYRRLYLRQVIQLIEEETMDKEKDFWKGMSCNLALKAFLSDYPNSIIGELSKYLPTRDVLWIIFLFSGQTIYITGDKDTKIKRRLLDREIIDRKAGKWKNWEPDTVKNFLTWFRGRKIYIPEWASIGKSLRNSLIFKALKRHNGLRNRQKLAKDYNITMRELARIYRREKDKFDKRTQELEQEELEKTLAK